MSNDYLVKSIIWSLMAKEDLTNIFENIKAYTKSERSARNVSRDILMIIRGIKYVNQYQVDEFLGEPYRRIIIRNYKVIYKTDLGNNIQVLAIISTIQQPINTL